MITGDLDRALGTEPSTAGAWRPVWPGDGGPRGQRAPKPGVGRAGEPAAAASGGVPGAYATSIAFPLARKADVSPATIAARLAERLRGLDWIADARATGRGYLTVTVTPGALAMLAVRIARAGPDCVRGEALRGAVLAAPADPGLAQARTWEQARRQLARHVTGRLAQAAGATVTWEGAPERLASAALLTGQPAASPVAGAIACAGLDAVAFALCRAPRGRRAAIVAAAAAAHVLGNPAYAVRYAHARAASALRQAAELGLAPDDPARFDPALLAHPSEQALLHELSWLPERAAGAARRGQPDAFARYLERLAEACLSCQEARPAAWPGMAAPDGSWGAEPGLPGPAQPGRAAPPSAEAMIVARLWLAVAARTALATGLGLLGVHAPDRL